MNLEEAGELFFPLVLNEYGKKKSGQNAIHFKYSV